MAKRLWQINQLIKKELSRLILKEVDFQQGLLVTITRVDTSPDLNQAKVFVSCMPAKEIKTALQSLTDEVYELQQSLNKRLTMKNVPKIIFREEKVTAQAGKVEEILEGLKKGKK